MKKLDSREMRVVNGGMNKNELVKAVVEETTAAKDVPVFKPGKSLKELVK